MSSHWLHRQAGGECTEPLGAVTIQASCKCLKVNKGTSLLRAEGLGAHWESVWTSLRRSLTAILAGMVNKILMTRGISERSLGGAGEMEGDDSNG